MAMDPDDRPGMHQRWEVCEGEKRQRERERERRLDVSLLKRATLGQMCVSVLVM